MLAIHIHVKLLTGDKEIPRNFPETATDLDSSRYLSEINFTVGLERINTIMAVKLKDGVWMDKEAHRAPENVIAELYELIPFETVNLQDWDKVKGLFIEETLIVLRLGPKTLRTFDRQSFIDYFIKDIERTYLKESGFTEKVLKSQMRIIEDIAHCCTLYEVSIPGRNDNRPVNRRIDSSHLIRINGRWLIASVINQGFRINEPIPAFLNKE